jgi:DNA adenine methylase
MSLELQRQLFSSSDAPATRPKGQLLKWIGNKQRFAEEIVSYFPADCGTYREPFLGSGAVLGTLAPAKGVASDGFGPLIGIWSALKASPQTLKDWYRERWNLIAQLGKEKAFEKVKAAYNAAPNSADLLFISRACYGGVIRFRKLDGYISTPCGAHAPISPESFASRVDDWSKRVQGTEFVHQDYQTAMLAATTGDVIYCDPPYTHSQTILYGAQEFSLARLFEVIGDCKQRGVSVLLSIDGTKKSGDFLCDLPIPQGLFEREILIDCGRSMLKRFQMDGGTLETEVVADRLLLTF